MDAVIPYEPAQLHAGMAAMSKAPGMAGMSSMDPDPVPAGERRFTVKVAVAATGRAGVPAGPESFTVRGNGLEPRGPRSSQLGGQLVPRGAATTGELTFQVPASASGLTLQFAGGKQPVELPAAPDAGTHDPAGH